MSGVIIVVGWESSTTIIKSLVDNGYQVKLINEGERTASGSDSYRIEFIHPVFETATFEVLFDGQENLRTWTSIKEGLKEDELVNQKTLKDIFAGKPIGDTDGDTPVRKKTTRKK